MALVDGKRRMFVFVFVFGRNDKRWEDSGALPEEGKNNFPSFKQAKAGDT